MVDCIGLVGVHEVKEDLDTVAVLNHDVVTVQSGAIVIEGDEDIDLISHLSCWLSNRPEATVIAKAMKGREIALEAWVSKVGGQVVAGAPEPAAIIPTP